MGPAQEGEGLSAYGPSSCTRPLLPEKGDQRNERGKETEGKEDGMTEQLFSVGMRNRTTLEEINKQAKWI